MRCQTTAPTTRCPFCGREYPKIVIPSFMGIPERVVTSRTCDCPDFLKDKAMRKRDERQEQLKAAWKRTGVPLDYKDVHPNHELLGSIDLEAGHGLYLHGKRGTGKTTEACRVLKAYVATSTDDHGWCSARFVSALDWLDKMQDAYHHYSASAEDEFQRAAGVEFLVLDDMGKVNSRVSDWTLGKLFRLVDIRYRNRKPTIYTSKYSLGKLAERLTIDTDAESAGDMVSRINQRCRRIEYDGPDLRLS